MLFTVSYHRYLKKSSLRKTSGGHRLSNLCLTWKAEDAAANALRGGHPPEVVEPRGSQEDSVKGGPGSLVNLSMVGFPLYM